MTDIAFSADFPAATEAQWREAALRALKGGDFERKLVSRTADGIAIQPLYAKSDGAIVARAAPGPWRIAQRIDLPAPDMANAQALDDLAGGADMLALVFAGAAGARGFGLAVETLADLDRALDGVALDLISLRLETAPWQGRVIAALLAALVEKRGLAPESLDLDVGLDPLGDFAHRGRAPAPFVTMFARAHEVAAALAARGFLQARLFRIDGRRPHEAGASEAQELAFALAAGVACLRALATHGVAADQARRLLSFLLVADADQFLTTAKFRAMRKLWARVEDACGLAPAPIRLDAETAWRMTTRRDPHTNMLRATIACFAAGVGGADSVAALPFSAALGAPDGFARRVARNAQLVLIEEAHLAVVADPAAGAGGFEALTAALCETAWTQFQEIEREGGLAQSLIDGRIQARISATRAARAKDAATRRAPITGTSEFPQLAERAPAVLAIEPPPPRDRSGGRLPGARLDFAGMIAKFAEGLPRGVMSATPQDGPSCEPLPSLRAAEPYEALRDASDAALAATGARPKIFLAALGPVAAFAARAMFAKNLFEAGGVEAISNEGFADDDGATDLIGMTDAFKVSGAALACVCGSDEAYAGEAADAALALAASGARAVYLAGRPGALETSLRAAGVRDFAFSGGDALAILRDAHHIGLS
jgi:methylmalonyl-CoA mutase